MKTHAEILAPCGDEQSFYAAIDAGADAVYLGLKSFNARAKAKNFSKENISEFVSYAHLFGVKVYVTINTLVNDNEINEFLKTFDACLKADVDAYIIQDFGIANLIRKISPSAVLHASTQMGVNNAYSAKALKDLGFSRVVLSRETSYDDVKEICALGIETEFFVQGALCVCFSGNCYLSSVKCDASGNRGLCRQLCRLRYKSNYINGHLLSAKDLCLAKNIKKLVETGITSLKIEGRLKRAAYVAQSVKTFRLALNSDDKEKISESIATLKKISSRGEYNQSAYLFSHDNIIDPVNYSYSGEFLGIVKSIEKLGKVFKVGVKTFFQLSKGDGLMINGVTMGIGNLDKCCDGYFFYTIRSGFPIGDKVFRTFDKSFEEELIPKKRLIKTNCHIRAFANSSFEITFFTKNKTFTASNNVLQKAEKRPLTQEDAKNNIKFDGAPLFLGDFSFETDGVFVKKSDFNELRRQALKGFLNVLQGKEIGEKKAYFASEKNQFLGEIKNIKIQLPERNYYILNEATLKSFDFGHLKANDAVVFSPTFYAEKTILFALKKCRLSAYTGTFFLNLPIVANGDEVRKIIKTIKKIKEDDGNVGVVVNNYYGFYFLKKTKCIAGIGLNVYSHLTLNALIEAGFEDCFSSIEHSSNGGKIYVGNPPLMTTVHCPYKVSCKSSCKKCTYDGKLTYTDEKKNTYILTRYKIDFCYFELRFANSNEYNNLVKNKGKNKVYDLRFF